MMLMQPISGGAASHTAPPPLLLLSVNGNIYPPNKTDMMSRAGTLPELSIPADSS